MQQQIFSQISHTSIQYILPVLSIYKLQYCQIVIQRMSNPNCKQWDCGEGCCNSEGNCVIVSSNDVAVNQCYYYYSSSSSSSSSYYSSSRFPSAWGAPLIAVGTFIIVFFIILMIRRYRRRNQPHGMPQLSLAGGQPYNMQSAQAGPQYIPYPSAQNLVYPSAGALNANQYNNHNNGIANNGYDPYAMYSIQDHIYNGNNQYPNLGQEGQNQGHLSNNYNYGGHAQNSNNPYLGKADGYPSK